MKNNDSFYQIMRMNGVTQRSFLKFCSLTATSLGLSSSLVPDIAMASVDDLEHSYDEINETLKWINSYE